jgi:hypothetical protein
VEDVEPFIEWLKGQGLPDAQMAAYRNYLAELSKHPSLSAAIKAAEEAGTPPREIANMRQVAARLVTFRDAPATPALPAKLPVASEPTFEVEARQPAAAPKRRIGDTAPPRRGCSCKKRYDLYLDNDFGALARWLGGGIGIGTLILIRMIGILGAACLALGLAGMGGLVTCFSICLRCEGCRQRVTDLDEDEIAHVRKGRGLTVLVTAGLLAGSLLCGYLWFMIMKHSRTDL